MSEPEVGSEVNIRIEVQNEFYEDQDGEDAERMEDDSAEAAIGFEMQADDNVNDFVIPFKAEIKVPDAKFGPINLEDGECSSNSSGSPEQMDVDSPGFCGDGENTQPQKSELNDSQSITDSSSMPRQPRRYPNPYVTEEMQKRVTRALRFGDTPFKFTQTVEELTKPTDEELVNFYVSMGLMSDNFGLMSLEKVNPSYRLDSVLIRGLNNMSTDEIFGYLYEQGLVPREMEWVNDACCVVIYRDKYEAAASLLKITKPIAVDPERAEKKKSLLIEDKPSLDDEESLPRKHSITGGDTTTKLDYSNSTIIPEEAITVPMPLGHVWRFANPDNNKVNKGILMRFAKTEDKKQERAEKHSEYYKKFGNPNSNFRPDGNGRHKVNRKFKRARVESVEVVSSSSEEEVKIDNKNAWTVLSASWGKEETGRNKAQTRVRTPIPTRHTRNIPSAGLTSYSRKYNFQPSAGASRVSSIHQRLGSKENKSFNDDFEKISDISLNRTSREAVSRKRVWSDEEDVDRSPGGNLDGEDDDDDDLWGSRLSGPRMKMHADEEETRQKLQAVRRTQYVGRRTVFGSGRLMPKGTELNGWDIDTNERRPVKERLGLRTESASKYVQDDDEAESEDGNLDEHDLRLLLDDRP